ncbi:MAG: winged helix-turn-helix domain-containing protein, partial [bacterium]
MAIPSYQSVMLPLLKFSSDKQEHSMADAIEHILSQFKLSDGEKKELLASGQPIIDNRVGWARTYLKKAGILESPKRGYLKITKRGLDVLKDNPVVIDVKFLRQFSEFVEFQTAKKDSEVLSQEENEINGQQTPEESLEYGYKKITDSLVQDLAKLIKNCSSKFFEKLVVELLLKMGYGGSIKEAGKAIGQSGDGGIDGIIKEDKLGLDVIYIQAKRWE